MAVRKLLHDTGNVIICRATWGGSQNFLGAPWVERVVDISPASARKRLALRLLSLSPHYFYDADLGKESARNRQSRQMLCDQLIAPYVTKQTRVLDYGCGPGYLAAAVAGKAAHVDAVDISRGVLACARVLNSQSNVTYQTPRQFQAAHAQVDVAYSFAVVQHLGHETLGQVLDLLAAAVRPGGLLILHFAEPGDLWRTEEQWQSDTSLTGRARLRYGLNCFGRTAAEMERLVADRGFTDVTARPLKGSLVLSDDDIQDQHLLTATRALG